jgi:hypothetical protein
MAYNFLHDDTFDGSLLPMPTLHKAVWAWIVSKARPDGRATGGGSVLLNPIILKTYFPDATIDDIKGVIKVFCDEDPDSRSTELQGRRLVLMGRDKYAVTTYTQHAGSRLARDAERKRQYRAERRESAAPGEAPPVEAEPLPAPPKPGTRHARSVGGLSPMEHARLMQTHAFVGERLRIPIQLHTQLVAQLGGNPSDADKKLSAWYLELQNSMGDEVIPNIFKFVSARFEQWVKPLAKPVDGTLVDDDAYARTLARSSTRHAKNLASPKEGSTT